MNSAFDLYLRLVDAMQARKQAGLVGDKAKLEQIADKMLVVSRFDAHRGGASLV